MLEHSENHRKKWSSRWQRLSQFDVPRVNLDPDFSCCDFAWKGDAYATCSLAELIIPAHLYPSHLRGNRVRGGRESVVLVLATFWMLVVIVILQD
jgi:hypothetical protein